MSQPADIFACDSLSIELEGRDIVSAVSFVIAPGAILVVHGDNGSGKTTLLNGLSGHLKSSRGRVHFEGRDVTNFGVEQLACLGIGRLFQHASAPRDFTVGECLFLTLATTGRLPAYRRSPDMERVLAFLPTSGAAAAVPFLRARSMSRLEDLSFAQQRYIEFVCALLVGSKVLLLDEPFAGVDSVNATAMLSMITAVRQAGRAVVVVEHATHLLHESDVQFLHLKAPAAVSPGGAHV